MPLSFSAWLTGSRNKAETPPGMGGVIAGTPSGGLMMAGHTKGDHTMKYYWIAAQIKENGKSYAYALRLSDDVRAVKERSLLRGKSEYL